MDEALINDHPAKNVSPAILEQTKLKLYMKPGHKVYETKLKCLSFFENKAKAVSWEGFSTFQNFEPMVSVEQNFDSLLIPQSYHGRRSTDVFYFNESHLLRTHLLAHLREIVILGKRTFVTIGEVFRQAEVDFLHSEFFHQVC